MTVRVYYEDTDMAGIVYYANYLKFIERGRSTMLRESAFSQNDLRETEGIVFAVTEVAAKFKRSAILDDELNIETQVDDVSRVKVVFHQRVLREDELLFEAEVTVACMSLGGRPQRIPDEAQKAFARYMA
ncbi:MAG: tol-pal system-associated acyl-CoA thioesterase [Pseudomonadota bacterium]